MPIDEDPLPLVTAAATASLTGLLALQGEEAALGLRWWATQTGVALEVVDDAGSVSAASSAYRRWIDEGVDILVGPYGSNLVRTVIPVATRVGVVMWNHTSQVKGELSNKEAGFGMVGCMPRRALPEGVPVLSRGVHRSPRKGACFMSTPHCWQVSGGATIPDAPILCWRKSPAVSTTTLRTPPGPGWSG